MVAVVEVQDVAKNRNRDWLMLKELVDLLPLRESEPTRLYKYDFYMLYWICEVKGIKSSEELHRLASEALAVEFEKHRDQIETLRKHRRRELEITGATNTAEESSKPSPLPRAKKRRRRSG